MNSPPVVSREEKYLINCLNQTSFLMNAFEKNVSIASDVLGVWWIVSDEWLRNYLAHIHTVFVVGPELANFS